MMVIHLDLHLLADPYGVDLGLIVQIAFMVRGYEDVDAIV